MGLDEWREDQEIQELIDRSLVNFTNELGRNKSRIEDVSAYHQGVWKILDRRNSQPDSASVTLAVGIITFHALNVVLIREIWPYLAGLVATLVVPFSQFIRLSRGVLRSANKGALS